MRADALRQGDQVMWFHSASAAMAPFTVEAALPANDGRIIQLRLRRPGERSIRWSGLPNTDITTVAEWEEDGEAIREAVYEDALIEGEPWAEDAHIYRMDALARGDLDD